MKHNWKYKKLGEVCTVIGGSTPRTDVPEYWVGDINWFTPAEINDQKYYFSSERKISKVAVTSSGLTLLPQGTVLLTSRAPIGKVGILCQEGYCNQGFKNLVCKEELYNEYLYYTLIYFKKEIEEKGRGATFKEISKKVTESIEIPVPPIEVQERIVAELDKLNEVIATKREQIKQLDLLAQSIFYDTFGDPVTNPKGWQMVSLKSVCSHIVDCPHSTPKKSSVPTDYPCIRTSELTDSGIDWTTMQYLDEAEYQKRVQRLKPQYGDLIYGREGTVGGCVIVPKEKHFSLGQRTMMFRPSTINSVFLLATFRSQWIRNQTERKIVGQTVKHINIKDLIEFTIPNPPIELQRHFAMRIEAIEKQKAQIEESIKELQTLLDSRMDYWFN